MRFRWDLGFYAPPISQCENGDRRRRGDLNWIPVVRQVFSVEVTTSGGKLDRVADDKNLGRGTIAEGEARKASTAR